VVGERGFCARFGGDEYVAACIGTAESFEGDCVAEFRGQLNEWIDHWNEQQQKAYTLGASVVIIVKEIQSVEDIDELMKMADENMYHCKERHHAVRESRRGTESVPEKERKV
jgi:GGDEF domain-containing protein